MKTFDTVYDQKDNSFNLFRFILASIVLYYHSYALLLNSEDPISNSINDMTIGTIAVAAFFIISGFFITQSFTYSKTFFSYFKKRILRIFPAFFLSLFLITFVLAPFISTIPLDYFSLAKGTPVDFLLKALSLHSLGYSWSIDSVFNSLPYKDSLNGSMWTLKFEFAAYLLMPLFLFLVNKNRTLNMIITVGIVSLAILNLITKYQFFNIPCCSAWVFSTNEYNNLILFLAYFLVGSNIFIFKDKIFVSYKIIFFMFFIFYVSNKFHGPTSVLMLLFLPYIVMSLGALVKVQLFTKYGDFSYGMYIFAFPIQQTIIYIYDANISVEKLIVLSFIVTFSFSIVSWFLLEKQALKLKGKR